MIFGQPYGPTVFESEAIDTPPIVTIVEYFKVTWSVLYAGPWGQLYKFYGQD